jgi:Cu2+-containing amine oxidase
MSGQRHICKSVDVIFGRGCLLLALLGILFLPARAQLPLDPLTPVEKEQAVNILLRDSRVQENLRADVRYRVVNVERHEEDKAVGFLGGRRADVVIYNYKTDETISAVVRLGNTAGVAALVITRDLPPALSKEEVDEGKRLALADATVQEKLREAGVDDTSSLIITHLLAQALNLEEACSSHRCIQFFFNTEEGALSVQPIADLSAERVYCCQ